MIRSARYLASASLLATTASAVLFPATASAQAPAAAPAAEEQQIVVTGRRISESAEAIGKDSITNTISVTREALLSAPSGISGLKMLETLPGFNVQTDGALGLYEFGNSVQTRAFNLDQIGFAVDGVPLGRSDAFGGSPVFRYVDNENLQAVRASPGAGDVSFPSYATLGPAVEYLSIMPQDDLGVFASQAFGDFKLRRTFIRVSSGQVGPLKGYLSRTKLDTNLWRGTGTVNREHWEANIHADIGADSWLRFRFVSNNFFDYDSPSLTRAEYFSATPDAGGQVGRYRGYIGFVPNYPALAASPTIPFSDPRYAYYYKFAINIRKDKLFALTFHGGLSPNASTDITAYYETKDGFGVSPDTYTNSRTRYLQQIAVGQAVVAPRGLQYGYSGVGGDRVGAVAKVAIDFGWSNLQFGIWGETDRYRRTQLRYNVENGNPDGAPLFNEVVYRRRDYRSQRNTVQLFVKDRIDIIPDTLSVELGVKALSVDYRVNGYRDFNDYARVVGTATLPGWGPQANSASYKDFFLPTVGGIWKIDGRTQVFASYAEAMALPKGMDDIFAVSLNSSNAVVPAPAPERSQNFELGIRTNQPEFFGAVTGYYTKFQNRIQAISSILPGTTNVLETFFQNVGRVESYGVEATGSYKPKWLNGLAYANMNVTYNVAKFLDDIPGVAATAGKTIPDSARWIVSGGITIEPASWLVANISGKYTSRRFANFTNTFDVPAFTVWSAYVDVGDGFSLGPLKNVRARLNIDNLFDKDVLSFISSSVTADGNFRPLSPRTLQLTLSVEI